MSQKDKVNPQSVYNGTISQQRNMFLSSSVAIAVIGFSNNFKVKSVRYLVKTLGALIFLISVFIGIKASNDLIHYLDNNKEQIPDFVNTKGWREISYVSYVYALILLVIAGLFLSNRIIFRS